MTRETIEGADDVATRPRLHGVWPVVLDRESPGGIRFARAKGEEAQAARIAADLPHAEVTLRTFRTHEEYDGYLAAVREFGGNGVHVEALELRTPRATQRRVAQRLVAALIIRFDRAPRPCHRDAPLGEAVALEGSMRDPSTLAMLADAAQRADTDAAAEDAWEKFWRPLIDDLEIGSGRRLQLDRPHGQGDNLVTLNWAGGTLRTLLLKRSEDGSVSVQFRCEIDPTIVAAAGFRDIGDNCWSAPTWRGREGAARLAATLDALATADGVARRRRIRVSTISKVFDEPRLMDVLQHAAAGFPLVHHDRHYVGYQLRPDSGRLKHVYKRETEALWDAGLIEPLTWDRRLEGTKIASRNDYLADGAVLLLASALGRALAAGSVDKDAAADASAASRNAAAMRLDDGSRHFAAAPALVAPPWLPAWTPPSGIAPPTLPGATKPRMPKRPEDLAVVAAWVLHGLLTVPNGAGDAGHPVSTG